MKVIGRPPGDARRLPLQADVRCETIYLLHHLEEEGKHPVNDEPYIPTEHFHHKEKNPT